jgi:uncharacterized membrane protein YqgA involved in biofilm formation
LEKGRLLNGIAGIKPFAVANMVPALFLAMPASAAWTRFLAR